MSEDESVPVPATQSDDQLFEILRQAAGQYDRYIEITKVAAFAQLLSRVEPEPHSTATPLSLKVSTTA